ncbi:hypothetical protein GQ53DRAFT_709535 [Thozetella sp. PMI_491]|nr:hypothetical protein GQ53DRAFT_709535 [Thozetella sp. PMI_491]
MTSTQPAATLVAFSNEPEGGYGRRSPSGSMDPPFFRTTQWSSDGTTLFTISSTNRLCATVVPHDLLEPRTEPVTLRAHGTLQFAEPTYEVAPCPRFSLDSPETQVVLAASQDHPIHLYPTFPPPASDGATHTANGNSSPLAHYNMIKPETEQYLPVRSMIWPGAGTHFIAGTKDLIAVFDINNAEPILPIKTIPSKRHRSAGHGIGMRGTVSALAAQPGEHASSSLVAAGTWQRTVGLYDLFRAGDIVATWNVKNTDSRFGGSGVAQTLWSPCGNYLLVNERRSTGLQIYDLRNTKQLLATLCGRESKTHQKLRCDVFSGSAQTGGFEVWAGTENGTVKVWEGVGHEGGILDATWDWEAHGSPVGSTAVHSCGSVVATCSGEWKVSDDGRNPAVGQSNTSSQSSARESSSSEDSGSDEPDTSGDSSSDESSRGESASPQQSPRQPLFVAETSLKIWSIGSTDLGQYSPGSREVGPEHR